MGTVSTVSFCAFRFLCTEFGETSCMDGRSGRWQEMKEITGTPDRSNAPTASAPSSFLCPY